MLLIRRYRDEDQASVRELHDIALNDAGAHAGAGPWDDDLDAIASQYLERAGEFLVGEVDGVVVAMGALRRRDDVTAEVKRMRVLPSYQRQGYGTRILFALEQRARELGYSQLALDTADQQVVARRFYEKHGYRETGTREWQGLLLRLFDKRL